MNILFLSGFSILENIICNVGIYMIRGYSWLQIQWIKYVSTKKPKTIENIGRFVSVSNSNGKILSEKETNLPESIEEEHSLFLQYDNSLVEFCSNRFHPKKCNFKLINVVCKFIKGKSSTEYNINLDEPLNYYYIGNSLNCFFIKYYLTNILHVDIENHKPFEYNLYIIDHEADIVTLDEKKTLVFGENSYIII
jgi:hypothetical protein